METATGFHFPFFVSSLNPVIRRFPSNSRSLRCRPCPMNIAIF
jgi:hypothetical protein